MSYINYYKDYIQTNKYKGAIVISYIIKTKEYDAYNIQLIYNNKTITVYKTSILSIAVNILNNHVNNENMLYIIDPKQRVNWIDNFVRDVEFEYYNLIDKKKRYTNVYHDYKIELTITQDYCDFLCYGHTIKIKSIIKNNKGRSYIHVVTIYYSDNYIDTSKAFNYILSCKQIYKMYIYSIENDKSYLNIWDWIVNNKYLNKLKNKFEAEVRSSLETIHFKNNETRFIDNINIEYKNYFSNNVLNLLSNVDK